MKYEFPWTNEGSGMYAQTTPPKQVEVTYHGHTIRFTPTNEEAINSGRLRTRVECLSCGKVLHEMTTGPKSVARRHWEHVVAPNFIEMLRERSQELDNLMELHRVEMDRLIYGNGFYIEDPHGSIERIHPQRVTLEERDGEITYFVDDFEADHFHHIREDGMEYKVLFYTDMGAPLVVEHDETGQRFDIGQFGAWADKGRGKPECVDTANHMADLVKKYGLLPLHTLRPPKEGP